MVWFSFKGKKQMLVGFVTVPFLDLIYFKVCGYSLLYFLTYKNPLGPDMGKAIRNKYNYSG